MVVPAGLALDNRLAARCSLLRSRAASGRHPFIFTRMNIPRSWIVELLRDFGRAIVGWIFWIDPDWDPTGTRPVSQIPWYISLVFCLVGSVVLLVCGTLLWSVFVCVVGR
jgi:hypothetical protein